MKRQNSIQSPTAKFLIIFAATGAGFLCGNAIPVDAQDFQYPISAAVADDGTVYVADRNLPGIWKMTGGKKEIYFQASKKFRTPLNAVRCVALDKQGRLLAGDSATRDVYRFDESGKPVPLTDGGIGIPMCIVVDGKGNLFVADLEVHHHRIWKIPAEGGEAELFADVPAPRGLAIDKENRLWVVSHGKNHLLRVSADGQIVEPVVEGRPFQFPHNVVLDDEQTAFVSDGYAKAIWKVPLNGKPEKWISGKPLVNPVGLAWHGEKLLIVDPRANKVFEADKQGKLQDFPGTSR